MEAKSQIRWSQGRYLPVTGRLEPQALAGVNEERSSS